MRLSWAQGAVAALSLTVGIGLLDTPSRLLGPASIADSPLNLPRTSSPSIVIAALPADAAPRRPRPAAHHLTTIPAPTALAVQPVPVVQPPLEPRVVQPAPTPIPTPRTKAPVPKPHPTPPPKPVPAPPAAAPAPTPPPTPPLAPPAATPPVPQPPAAAPVLPATGEPASSCPPQSRSGNGHDHDGDHPPHGKACGYDK
jgi:hypothetical protein